MERLEGRTLLTTVTSVTTNLTANASAIVISGTGFDPIVANDSVLLTNGAQSAVAGTITAATPTSLNVSFPTSNFNLVGGNLTAEVTADGVSNGSYVQVATIQPVVTVVTDQLATNAGAVVISGYGFDPTMANDAVTFDGGSITGTVSNATANSLTVTIPSDPTAGSLTAVVTVNTVAAAQAQVATITPVVTGTTTNGLAANATAITINGFGFDTTAVNNTITFDDGAVAGTITNATATSLTLNLATDPTTAGALNAVVSTNGAISGLPVQVATIAPVVTATTTNTLPANLSTVTINGFGFDTTVANDAVTFTDGTGTATGTVTSATPTSLTVTFGTRPTISGSLTAVVNVTENGTPESSGAAAQVATVIPVVTSSTANLAINGTTITINGYGFDSGGTNSIVFSGAAAGTAAGTISNVTSTSFTVTFTTEPGAVGVLNARVTTDTEASAAAVQVATVTPVVLANTQYLVPAGATSLTINGLGFSTTGANDTVTFNDGAVAGTITNATATSLTLNLATDPTIAGPLTAVVSVTANGTTENSGAAVEVAAVTPVVTSGSPASLPANASTITITGSGFDPTIANDAVTFSDGAVGTITAATATSLTVALSTKPAAAGPLTAIVGVTENGTTESSGPAVQVSTVTPVVTTGSAALLATAGTLTINGYGFNSTTFTDNVVTLSSGVGTVTNATNHSLTVTFSTPPTAGALTASVTANGQSSGAQVQVCNVVPVVTSNVSYRPTAGATTILINGYGFDTTSSNDSVAFSDGAVVQSVVANSANLLTVQLSTSPSTAGSLTAVVTTDGESSAAVQVATVTPVVTASTASLAAGLTTLTISGAGFDPTASANTIVLHDGTGTATGTVTAATATSLTVTFGTAPTVAGPLTATVTTDSVSSGLAVQVATVAPVVTSSTATLAANAATVTISGIDFDSTMANDRVTFTDGTGTAVGSVTAASTTSLTVTFSTLPTVVGSLTAVVTSDNVSSGSAVQVATVVPVVTSSTGNLAANASSIVIHGSDFDTTASNDSVTFNDGAVVQSITANSSTSLTVTFATKPTAGNLTAVVTADGDSSGTAVQVATVAPVVTSNTTNPLAANAATLTINGSGFDPAGVNTVAFNNGATGTVTAATATALTVAFAPGASTMAGPLTAIVTTDGASSGAPVQVATITPVVTASTLDLAANAATLTINGYGFNGTTPSDNTVVFNGAAVGTVTASTTTSLTVTFSAAPTGGALTATVTTNGQSSASGVQVANVVPVVLSNVSYRPTAGATTVIINGYGFDTTSSHDSVTFGDGAMVQSITVNSANMLTVQLSASPATAGSLTAAVTTNGESSTAVQVATVTPVLTSSTTGLAAGSTTLTIAGQGFDPTAINNTIVLHDGTGTATGTVTSATATSLTVAFGTLPTVAGPLTAVVTTDGVSSGTPVQVATVAPAVTSSTASLAANSTTLTINGIDFDSTMANNTVTFVDGAGTAVGAVTAASTTSLTVTFSTLPTAVGSLTAVVTTDNVSSVAAVQVATVVPAVTVSTTNLAASAGSITIQGLDFDTTASNDSVTFNDGATVQSIVANSSTSLTVTFATKPTAGNLTAVVTSDGASSGTPVQVATVAPVVTSGSPANLPANAATIVINGNGFDPLGVNTVVFNDGAAGTVTAATATALTVTFSTNPTSAGPLTAVVTTDGAAGSTPVQVATVQPIVTSSTASLAANAAQVIISGYGFSSTQSHDSVAFSDGAAGTVIAASPTSLTVSLLTDPTSVANLNATVTANGVSSSTVQVAAITPVVLSNTAYQIAGNASTVTINGFGFDTTLSHNLVTLNEGAVGTVTAATPTSLTVTFSTKPVTAGNLTASVTTDGASSGAAVQVAAVAPVVTASTATLAANAATLTINGVGFSPTAASNTVNFLNGAAGTVTAATTTSLTVTFTTAPVAGRLMAIVHTNGASSGAAVQVASVTPAVTASTASLASTAASITISGYGFDSSGTNTVTFSNGAVASGVTVNSATSLTVTFGTKPSAGNLTAVVTTDGVSSGTPVQVATVAPVVTTSSASLLANAATITISGSGFDTTPAHNTVAFSSGAGIVTAATATSLTVTFTAAPTAGNLTAVVTTNGASSASVQVAAVAPVVTASTASQAINATTIVINGYGFDPTATNNTVTFTDGTGSAAGTVTAATATSLTVTFSTLPTIEGSLTAVVHADGANSGSAVQVGTVSPVVTSSVANLSGSSTTVTINGFGFDTTYGNNTVVFDDGAVGTVTAGTATSLTVTFSTKPSAGDLTAVVTSHGVGSGAAVQVATVAPVMTLNTASQSVTAATITIGGSGFDTTPGNNTVVFNDGAVGTVIGATATSLTVAFSTDPTTAGSLTAAVTTDSANSGTAVQVATLTPVVTASTVNLAENGTSLVIGGFGFDPLVAHDTVVFSDGSGTATGTVTAATATSLTVSFATAGKPTATGSLTGIVTTDGQTSGAAVQVATVVAAVGSAPSVTASTASLAANASGITIHGSNFSATPGNNTVTFSNGAAGTVTGSTTTSLTVSFTTAPTAGNLTAVVYTSGVSSGTAVQVAAVTPVVTSSTANQAINGSTLTINGFGFDPTASGNTVVLSSGAGNVTAATPTSLTVTLSTKPSAMGSLTATVTTDTVAGSSTQVATVVPVVTASTANLAINAGSIVINGFGFSATAANNTVTFNDGAVAGTITAATTTSLTVTLATKPTSLGSLTATVGVAGATSTAAQVATVVPVVTSSTANLSATAATLTINGFGFDTTPSKNTVLFNNGAAGVVTGATATSLTVTFSVAPAAGSITAAVTTDGVSSGTQVQVATVVPVVTGSAASLAANAAQLVITGFGFSLTPSKNVVTFNGLAVGTVTAATATSLTVSFTSASKLTAGSLTASVATNSTSSGTPVQVATVTPVVTSTTTNSLAANATGVTINGFGFDTTFANNTVVFTSDGAVGTVTAATATSLTVTFSTSPTAAGALNAIVHTDGVSSGAAVQVATVTPVVTSSTTSQLATASTVSISGFGFDPTSANNTVVFSNGAVGTATGGNANSLTVTFSTLPTAGKLMAAVTSFGVSSGNQVQVAAIAPVVTTSTASLATSVNQVVITGTGFDPTAANNTVAFNDGAVGTVQSATKTSLTVVFTTGKKPVSAGPLTAIVTTNSVSSGSIGVQVGTWA
jgi:hypothetical protein